METHYGHIFIKRPDPHNRFDDTKVRIATSSETLTGVIGAFEEYLKACGFHFEGRLEIIDDQDEANSEEDFITTETEEGDSDTHETIE